MRALRLGSHRFAGLCLAIVVALPGMARADSDALVDALGVPQIIQAFAREGGRAGADIDATFLNGQGGSVWAETVRRLYDPTRIEAEVRAALIDALDDDVAAQALLYFESDVGMRAVTLEVQARAAFIDPEVEAAARAAPAARNADVTALIETRDIVVRNTDIAVAARAAFFDGLSGGTGQGDTPDIEAMRPGIATDTESWLRGYFALIHSAMSPDDIAINTAFWATDVGRAVDDALFAAFGASYTTLSYALGQAAGRLAPQNDL